jgi:hypothetical protein
MNFCAPLRSFRDNCICSDTMCICADTDLAIRSQMHEGCVDGSHRQSRDAKKLSAETSLPSAVVQLSWEIVNKALRGEYHRDQQPHL